MTDPTDVPNVSMANTKKELLEAYEAAKKRFDSLNKDLLDAKKTRKRLEKKMAEATADSEAAQDPVTRLHELRGAISRELTDLAERFETEIETYRKIKSAIDTKQGELDTIYEVETAASDLAALIDAQRVEKEQFGQDMEAQKAAFEGEMQERRTQWQREKADHDRQVKEQADTLGKQRQREKEEHEYAFAREHAQRKNALEDELQALEKELAVKRNNFEDDVRLRTASLDTREEAIAAREKDMALMEARFEGERNVLLGKIEALEKVVSSQAAQIGDLSKKSELAYEKVQDIANRAVTASRRESYPVPGHHSAASGRDDSQA